MSTPYYQPLDPAGAPDPVTPADSPSDPRGYGMVTPAGAGTAPYNVQDDLGAIQSAIQTAYDGAGSVAAAGVVVYPSPGPRQAQAAHLMDSPMGFNSGGGTSGWDITAGYSGSADDPGNGWPNNPQPPIIDTFQAYPDANTGTD